MDIVERLRNQMRFGAIGAAKVRLDAANEIERLRNDEKKYQAVISKLLAKKVADEYWSKILQGDDFDPWAALKEGE